MAKQDDMIGHDTYYRWENLHGTIMEEKPQPRKPLPNPWLALAGEESSFRANLWAAAQSEDCGEWQDTALVFSDWLEERGRPEAALARCEWERVGKRKQQGVLEGNSGRHGVFWCETWAVTMPWTGNGDRWQGRINSMPILHVPPQCLVIGKRSPCLTRDTFRVYVRQTPFTADERRLRLDTDVDPRGIAALAL